MATEFCWMCRLRINAATVCPNILGEMTRSANISSSLDILYSRLSSLAIGRDRAHEAHRSTKRKALDDGQASSSLLYMISAIPQSP